MPAGVEERSGRGLLAPNEEVEPKRSSNSDAFSAWAPLAADETYGVDIYFVENDEENDSTTAIPPSTPQATEFEDESIIASQPPPFPLQYLVTVDDGTSFDSDYVLTMPLTPRLAAQDYIQTTTSEDSLLSIIPQSPSPIPLFGNAPHQSGPRSLPVPPERPPSSDFDPLSTYLPSPSPVFLSKFTPHWSDDNPQVRPLPQTRVPPPRRPPLQATPISLSPQFQPINHPNPLGSYPPQGPPAMLAQNPQPHLTPQLAPVLQMQEIPLAGNIVNASMPLGPDNLRQPEQFSRAQNQPRRNAPRDGQQAPWNLPGNEIVSPARDDRPIDGHWMGGEFFLVHVGGKAFRIPKRLLAKYPFWTSLTFLEQPSQGWSMPGINPDIFTVLIESIYSTSGLHGTEPGLNLVKICFAITLAWKWGMQPERRKLRDTVYRYIVRKVMHYNPYLPDERGILNHNHYVYRSEELYRTWELAIKYHYIHKIVTQHDLTALYRSVIPQDMWPALTAHFKPEFMALLEVSAAVRANSAETGFQDWWLRFYRLAGYLEANWLSPDAANRLFGPLHQDENGDSLPVQERAEFEAARARGNALMNAFEAQQGQEQPLIPTTSNVPTTLTAPTTPTTPTTPSVAEEENIYDASPRGSPSRRHSVGRRVRFAQLPEIITPPHERRLSQMTAHSATVNSSEETAFHGEAAPAA
ncbi:hypothetical protein ACHAQJ_004406 [Trichoderma viride]